MPKWGISRGNYSYDKEHNIIAKGLSSIKYMGDKIADELYNAYMTKGKDITYFMDLLKMLDETTSLDTRQLDILIKLDFFSSFGNQRVLLRLTELFYGIFKRGDVCQISKLKIKGTTFEHIVQKYSVGITKAGTPAKSYTILDARAIMIEEEEEIKSLNVPDMDIAVKAKNFKETMGYYGYVSGEQKDRPKLQITKMFPVKRRSDNVQFGYRILTKSLGSGIESSFTIFNTVYKKCPVEEGDVILCKGYTRNNGYYTMTRYEMLS